MFANIKVKDYLTEEDIAEYSARIESAHPAGPYEPHKHNGGQK